AWPRRARSPRRPSARDSNCSEPRRDAGRHRIHRPAARSMSAMAPFQYAILRVVPRVERGERMNAGVVLFCRPRRYLAARAALDEARLAAFAPGLDLAEVREHLEA